MKKSIRPLVVGNWKMNGLRASLEKIEKIAQGIEINSCHIDVVICPPATLMDAASRLCDKYSLIIGAQDCHMNEFGAYTGDISASMLADCGAQCVILGHSERRIGHQESSKIVQCKVKSACNAGLDPIICIGETGEEYRSGKTFEVLQRQLDCSFPDDFKSSRPIVAYEPVWAIGTGNFPSIAELDKTHSFVRRVLLDRFPEEGQKMRILYGGSVSIANVKDFSLIENIDGLLVGGASLQDESFLKIIEIFERGYVDYFFKNVSL
ncbi:triose-phosphate isomerase [Candidatus Liberibacter africanus]|uniref:triose-phosphate isomerase n=1 Tax=Liberibacter africanus TaxID=34020 RepID=UPI000A043B2A|nr:triose-phosphate isomerase [Candidatus Liberibacter africanus]QTP64355.1 triose-phosphate isomerase [Candidatus Liberibacter africanus]